MIYTLEDRQVELIVDSHFIAPNATVIGSVVLHDRVSIWFNAVLRGDNDPIVVGEGSNVQDGCVLHADPGFPLTLDRYVTIGHMAMVHGCTIGERTLIGIGAVVLNGARIGRNCVIGAGSFVKENAEIPDNSLVVGSPGKVIRTMSEEQVQGLKMFADSYMGKIDRYRSLRVDPRFAADV